MEVPESFLFLAEEIHLIPIDHRPFRSHHPVTPFSDVGLTEIRRRRQDATEGEIVRGYHLRGVSVSAGAPGVSRGVYGRLRLVSRLADTEPGNWQIRRSKYVILIEGA